MHRLIDIIIFSARYILNIARVARTAWTGDKMSLDSISKEKCGLRETPGSGSEAKPTPHLSVASCEPLDASGISQESSDSVAEARMLDRAADDCGMADAKMEKEPVHGDCVNQSVLRDELDTHQTDVDVLKGELDIGQTSVDGEVMNNSFEVQSGSQEDHFESCEEDETLLDECTSDVEPLDPDAELKLEYKHESLEHKTFPQSLKSISLVKNDLSGGEAVQSSTSMASEAESIADAGNGEQDGRLSDRRHFSFISPQADGDVAKEDEIKEEAGSAFAFKAESEKGMDENSAEQHCQANFLSEIKKNNELPLQSHSPCTDGVPEDSGVEIQLSSLSAEKARENIQARPTYFNSFPAETVPDKNRQYSPTDSSPSVVLLEEGELHSEPISSPSEEVSEKNEFARSDSSPDETILDNGEQPSHSDSSPSVILFDEGEANFHSNLSPAEVVLESSSPPHCDSLLGKNVLDKDEPLSLSDSSPSIVPMSESETCSRSQSSSSPTETVLETCEPLLQSHLQADGLVLKKGEPSCPSPVEGDIETCQTLDGLNSSPAEDITQEIKMFPEESLPIDCTVLHKAEPSLAEAVIELRESLGDLNLTALKDINIMQKVEQCPENTLKPEDATMGKDNGKHVFLSDLADAKEVGGNQAVVSHLSSDVNLNEGKSTFHLASSTVDAIMEKVLLQTDMLSLCQDISSQDQPAVSEHDTTSQFSLSSNKNESLFHSNLSSSNTVEVKETSVSESISLLTNGLLQVNEPLSESSLQPPAKASVEREDPSPNPNSSLFQEIINKKKNNITKDASSAEAQLDTLEGFASDSQKTFEDQNSAEQEEQSCTCSLIDQFNRDWSTRCGQLQSLTPDVYHAVLLEHLQFVQKSMKSQSSSLPNHGDNENRNASAFMPGLEGSRPCPVHGLISQAESSLLALYLNPMNITGGPLDGLAAPTLNPAQAKVEIPQPKKLLKLKESIEKELKSVQKEEKNLNAAMGEMRVCKAKVEKDWAMYIGQLHSRLDQQYQQDKEIFYEKHSNVEENMKSFQQETISYQSQLTSLLAQVEAALATYGSSPLPSGIKTLKKEFTSILRTRSKFQEASKISYTLQFPEDSSKLLAYIVGLVTVTPPAQVDLTQSENIDVTGSEIPCGLQDRQTLESQHVNVAALKCATNMQCSNAFKNLTTKTALSQSALSENKTTACSEKKSSGASQKNPPKSKMTAVQTMAVAAQKMNACGQFSASEQATRELQYGHTSVGGFPTVQLKPSATASQSTKDTAPSTKKNIPVEVDSVTALSQTVTADLPSATASGSVQSSSNATEPQNSSTSTSQSSRTAAPQSSSAAEPQISSTSIPQSCRTAAPQSGSAAEPQISSTSMPQSSRTVAPQRGSGVEPQYGSTSIPQSSCTTSSQNNTIALQNRTTILQSSATAAQCSGTAVPKSRITGLESNNATAPQNISATVPLNSKTVPQNTSSSLSQSRTVKASQNSSTTALQCTRAVALESGGATALQKSSVMEPQGWITATPPPSNTTPPQSTSPIALQASSSTVQDTSSRITLQNDSTLTLHGSCTTAPQSWGDAGSKTKMDAEAGSSLVADSCHRPAVKTGMVGPDVQSLPKPFFVPLSSVGPPVPKLFSSETKLRPTAPVSSGGHLQSQSGAQLGCQKEGVLTSDSQALLADGMQTQTLQCFQTESLHISYPQTSQITHAETLLVHPSLQTSSLQTSCNGDIEASPQNYTAVWPDGDALHFQHQAAAHPTSDIYSPLAEAAFLDFLSSYQSAGAGSSYSADSPSIGSFADSFQPLAQRFQSADDLALGNADDEVSSCYFEASPFLDASEATQTLEDKMPFSQQGSSIYYADSKVVREPISFSAQDSTSHIGVTFTDEGVPTSTCVSSNLSNLLLARPSSADLMSMSYAAAAQKLPASVPPGFQPLPQGKKLCVQSKTGSEKTSAKTESSRQVSKKERQKNKSSPASTFQMPVLPRPTSIRAKEDSPPVLFKGNGRVPNSFAPLPDGRVWLAYGGGDPHIELMGDDQIINRISVGENTTHVACLANDCVLLLTKAVDPALQVLQEGRKPEVLRWLTMKATAVGVGTNGIAVCGMRSVLWMMPFVPGTDEWIRPKKPLCFECICSCAVMFREGKDVVCVADKDAHAVFFFERKSGKRKGSVALEPYVGTGLQSAHQKQKFTPISVSAHSAGFLGILDDASHSVLILDSQLNLTSVISKEHLCCGRPSVIAFTADSSCDLWVASKRGPIFLASLVME